MEEDVGHTILQEDFKDEEEQEVFEDQSVLLEHPHEDMSFCDASTSEFNIASSYHDKDLDCSSMNVETYGSLLEAQAIREDMEFDPLLSEPATKELSLESNEGIYNSSLDWLPISYNRVAIYLLVGDLLSISNGDSMFGRSPDLFSHDDYHLTQDLLHFGDGRY